MKILDTIWNYFRSLNFEIRNIFEILIIAVVLYYAIVWVKRSRTWFLFRGLVVLLFFVAVANLLELSVITYLARETLTWIVIALIVIFQPELRSGLERLGQKNYLLEWLGRSKIDESGFTHEVTEELVKGCFAMARNKTGALIVIERELPLSEYAKTGIRLDALVSGALLINIFEKNTPLHDGAVIIKGNRVTSATCYLPLSSNTEISKNLGTRHRAAIGVSEASDSVTIVVSEETGAVSLARGGALKHNLTPEQLRAELTGLEEPLLPEGESGRRKVLGFFNRIGEKNEAGALPDAPAEKEADKLPETSAGKTAEKEEVACEKAD